MISHAEILRLFPLLDKKLMELLHSLQPEEWHAPTVAKRWKVKDVVAHLLDGNLRALSLERDRYFGTEGPASTEFDVLTEWLNRFNNEWVDAARRISPQVLILLHEATGKPACDYFASLDPEAEALFAVSWAGEKQSTNRFHLARQYTEKFLHQQQIRDALNRPGIMTREFFYPFISIFMQALPHTYRNVEAVEGTAVKLVIPSDIGGQWAIEMIDGQWQPMEVFSGEADAEVIIEPDIAWKLFSKSIRPQEIRDQVTINGHAELGEVALNMVSVMA